jgi:hypothetical protein
MGTPGTPMSIGQQLPMTLYPSTSNLSWSRLRTTVLPSSLLPGHHLILLPAMRHGLDRGEMPSTYTGYHGQLGLFMRESTKQPDSLVISVLVSLGEEEIDETVLYPAIPSFTTAGYQGQLGLHMLESNKQPDSLIIVAIVFMGEEKIVGPDVRRPAQLHVATTAVELARLQLHSVCGTRAWDCSRNVI